MVMILDIDQRGQHAFDRLWGQFFGTLPLRCLVIDEYLLLVILA